MNKLTQKLPVALVALALSIGLASCKKKEETENAPSPTVVDKYALWLQVGSYPNTAPYVANTNSLTEGTISLSGNGAEVTGTADYGIIPRNGYYYYYNTPKARFSKFTVIDSKLTEIQGVPLTHLANNSAYAWADDHTLVMFGTNGDGNKVLYSSIDVNTMRITNGELNVPAIPTGFVRYNIGTAEFADGKFFLPLAFIDTWQNPFYAKASIAVINYPDFTYNKMLEDNRSVGAGSSKLWMPSSFVDEKGDAYFMTNPYKPINDFPTVIYRIKKGTTSLDSTYFFNINASSIANDAVGLWYVGNGVAVVRFKNAAFTAPHIYGFAALNVADGTVRKILTDLPADKGGTIQSITVDNGKAYILANSETGKDYVWEYDPATDQVRPGLEITGGYDFLLRVDKLK